MEIKVSQVTLKREKLDPRVHSACPIPGNGTRPNHAFSAHSVLPPASKIEPKSVSRSKNPPVRHSESTYVKKSNPKSMVRYKKLDLTAGDVSFGGNPLKEYKRKVQRNKMRGNLQAS